MAKDKLTIEINADDNASGKLGNIGGALKTIGKTAAVGAAAFVGATAAIGGGMIALAADAAPLEGIQGAFDGLAEASGKLPSEMLTNLELASSGMVSQRDLMMSYNQAAQLVSQDFANTLPDAMGYLAKVSAATGQDMGFMLDSLVKGVGRLSPMILDNLGIQVTLADATSRAAEMFGLEADALTKTQIQAGMMDVVLAKLAENTASMPEVAGTAAAGFAAIGVSMQNLKDSIGLELLPIMEPLLTGLTALAQEYGPQVVEIFGRFAETMSGTLPQAMLLVNDALTRLNVVFGGSAEPISLADTVLGALKLTLDAGVVAVQLIAVAMEGLAGAAEWVSGAVGTVAGAIQSVTDAVNAGIDGWNKYSEAAQAAFGWMTGGGGGPGGGGSGVGSLGTWAGAPGLPGGAVGGVPGVPPGLQFQYGGIVPGPIGSPQLAMVHGGETVLPTHTGGGGGIIENHINLTLDGEIVGKYMGRQTSRLQRMGGMARL